MGRSSKVRKIKRKHSKWKFILISFREALWNYFLPTLYEECPVTAEPTVGQSRIFKNFRFKLWLLCPTVFDLYFMNKKVVLFIGKGFVSNEVLFSLGLLKKLHQIHGELPQKDSYFDAIFPFSCNPDGFDTSIKMNLFQPTIRTNLSFSPLLQAERVDVRWNVRIVFLIDKRLFFFQIDVHIHYPRMWNSIQDWTIDLVTNRVQLFFVFEHKNFFQGKERKTVFIELKILNETENLKFPVEKFNVLFRLNK